MRKFSSRFLVKTVALFAIFTFFLNSFNVNIFMFPVFPFLFTVAVFEKNVYKRLFIIIFSLFIFIQVGSPLPFIFLFSLSIQLYILSLAIFEITTFEISVLSFFSVFTGHIITNLNLFLFVYFISNTMSIVTFIINIVVGLLVQILLFAFFKAEISVTFVKDRWL